PIKYADELKTLLTWQFQTFGKVEKKEKRMAA
ncbi:MAG: hypothetical protein ACI9S8_002631, partial [Chlamydiales bacterium]